MIMIMTKDQIDALEQWIETIIQEPDPRNYPGTDDRTLAKDHVMWVFGIEPTEESESNE